MRLLVWLIGLLVIAQPAWAQPIPEPLRINQLFATQVTSKVVDYVIITAPPLAPTGACRLYVDGTSLYMSCNGGAYTAFRAGTSGVSQAFVVCTGAACATSCTLTFTAGILTGSSGTCP